MLLAFFGLCLVSAVATGCAPISPDLVPGAVPRPPAQTAALPVMRWDHRPEAAAWTKATLAALQAGDAPLLAMVPSDVAQWCPGYAQAGASDRAAFWSGILSALAKYESTWNPEAAGGGGAYIGLLQISPQTAAAHGCSATTVSALKDGAANLQCGVRIASQSVPRDGALGTGRNGLAADWGPFQNEAKRSEMMAWTRTQRYCQG